jgi:hypothetical protein
VIKAITAFNGHYDKYQKTGKLDETIVSLKKQQANGKKLDETMMPKTSFDINKMGIEEALLQELQEAKYFLLNGFIDPSKSEVDVSQEAIRIGAGVLKSVLPDVLQTKITINEGDITSLVNGILPNIVYCWNDESGSWEIFAKVNDKIRFLKIFDENDQRPAVNPVMQLNEDQLRSIMDGSQLNGHWGIFNSSDQLVEPPDNLRRRRY